MSAKKEYDLGLAFLGSIFVAIGAPFLLNGYSNKKSTSPDIQKRAKNQVMWGYIFLGAAAVSFVIAGTLYAKKK